MLLLALTVSGSLGRHYIAMFEATQNVMLKPTESWREALLDTRVMDLFFTVSDLPPPGHVSCSTFNPRVLVASCCLFFLQPHHLTRVFLFVLTGYFAFLHLLTTVFVFSYKFMCLCEN